MRDQRYSSTCIRSFSCECFHSGTTTRPRFQDPRAERWHPGSLCTTFKFESVGWNSCRCACPNGMVATLQSEAINIIKICTSNSMWEDGTGLIVSPALSSHGCSFQRIWLCGPFPKLEELWHRLWPQESARSSAKWCEVSVLFWAKWRVVSSCLLCLSTRYIM